MNRRRFLSASALGSLGAGCSRYGTTPSPQEISVIEAPHSASALEPVALVTDPRYLRHDPGPGHPEQPARAARILESLEASGLPLRPLDPRKATEDELRACHSAGYIAQAKQDITAGLPMLSTGDTHVCRESLDTALLAAGGVCTAVDEVFSQRSGTADRAFCLVRPPGHHAEANKGMGFCVFGNIAVGARYAQSKHGAERILIVDWDVHHGNGTQDIFYDDPSVFFFSTHQSPWYPGTGAANETGSGPGEGSTLNCPLAAGAGRDKVYEQAFRRQLLDGIQDFKPDVVMISAGFDSRIDDPLGQFVLEDQDFADLTLCMREIAHRSAAGRVVSVLEGGYNLDGLASATTAHVRALAQPA